MHERRKRNPQNVVFSLSLKDGCTVLTAESKRERRYMKNWSLSAWVAGFLAVLISYCGPLVIFIQAAKVGGFSQEMLSSWIWAISIGAGVSGLALSLWLRMPVITAWTAPGTALLINLFPEISMAEVVGAYFSAALITAVIGVSGYFERIVHYIPKGIAAAMMAGILFQFGVQAFQASMELPSVVFAMLGVYLVSKRLWPSYTVILVAITGFAMAYLQGHTQLDTLSLQWGTPIFTMPEFSLKVFFSFTIPLVVVSLTGQFLPGMVVMRLAGYNMPSRAVVTGTGLASMVVAFFGGITVVLAAITAALCTGKESHADPEKRYVAGIANGVIYLIGGTLAGSIVLIFNAIPAALVAALAGLALIGAIVANIRLLADDLSYIEPSVITFLVTASGMSLGGLGSAFWGVVIGLIAYWVLRVGRVTKRTTP